MAEPDRQVDRSAEVNPFTSVPDDDGATSPIWFELASVARAFDTADGLLAGLDFDGTLASIASDPDAPSLSRQNRTSLRRLAAHERVQPAVISGRELSDLRARVDVDGVAYAGNHGLELHVDGRTVTHPIADRRRDEVAAVSHALADAFESIEGCFVEDKQVTATVHYRLVSTDLVDRIRTTVAETVDRLAEDHLRISEGKEVIEIGPAVHWNKGSAIRLLSDRVPSGWHSLYVGDDTTDEHAFRELRAAGLGIHVGTGPTAATYRLADTADVELFLRWLASYGVRRLERSA